MNPLQTTAVDLRRAERLSEDALARRERIGGMYSRGLSSREMYDAGSRDGGEEKVSSLADILYTLRERGLGRASVIQESNSHVIFKVFDCACCEIGRVGNCIYLAGFLAGALRATGRPGSVRVREISCGEFPGRTCVFAATW